MRECRCPRCGRYLVKFKPIEGLRIEIRCRRCKNEIVILFDRIEILQGQPLTASMH